MFRLKVVQFVVAFAVARLCLPPALAICSHGSVTFPYTDERSASHPNPNPRLSVAHATHPHRSTTHHTEHNQAGNASLQRNKQRLHAARAQGDAHMASVSTAKMDAVGDWFVCVLWPSGLVRDHAREAYCCSPLLLFLFGGVK